MSPFVRRSNVRHCDRVMARGVLLILLAIYTATFTGLPEVLDGEIEFQTTRSLALGRGLAIGDDTPEGAKILEYARDAQPGEVAVMPGPHNGAAGDPKVFYSWYGVGQAAAAVPFYWVGVALDALTGGVIEDRHREAGHYGLQRSEYLAHLFVGWRNPLLSALTAWLLVLSARRFGVSRWLAFASGLSYGLCTYAWPQARSSLSDVQATFLLFCSFHLIMRLREGFERLEAPRRRDLVGLGLALGMAVLTRVSVAGAAIILLAACEVQLSIGFKRLIRFLRSTSTQSQVQSGEVPRVANPWRARAWVAGPAILCFLVFLVTNHLRFGGPLDFGYNRLIDGGLFGGSLLYGLAGSFVAPGKGLLWMAPGLLLFPLGLRAARDKGEGLWMWTTLALGVAIVLPPASMSGWYGGWTFGPRYLLPLLPFLWLGVALALPDVLRHAWGKRWAVGLMLLGLLVQVPAALVDHSTHEDLAVQAARIAWPDLPGEYRDQEEERFQRIQWTWSFAAPWAHWRILRRRLQAKPELSPEELALGLPAERFSAFELYGVGTREQEQESASQLWLTPQEDVWIGFRHLAWVDWHQRLRLSTVAPGLLILGLFVAGIIACLRGAGEGRT